MPKPTIQRNNRGKATGLLRDDGANIPLVIDNTDYKNAITEYPELVAEIATDGPVTERRIRTLLAIYNDINALSGAQKTAIWTDLMSGSPPKLSQNIGAAADAMFLIWRMTANVSMPAATIADMKLTAATMYVRDNPTYLVAPTFDNTINVPGDEAVP